MKMRTASRDGKKIMSKSKKSLKILIFGVISQLVTLLMGIIIPRLVIVSYGSEVNGLLSSIRQIFACVSLLEAGVGTAALQAMYAPIANNDLHEASRIIAAADRYFKRTGILYGAAVVLLALFYPVIVKTELDYAAVAAVILLQGASGVIKYFFLGKLTVLLRVDGKSYITTNAATVMNAAVHLIQIILILYGFDIIAVQTAYFAVNLIQMLYITRYVRRNYGWIDTEAKPDYSALRQSRYVIIHQISGLIFNNTDIVILTVFCGLKTVSVYSLYNLIYSCVSNVIDTVCSSVEFILGQAFNSDREHFLRLQEVYETYYLGISFAFFTAAAVLFPSFIRIYTAGVTDVNYSDPRFLYLFTALNVLMYSRRTSSQIINFAGHFRQTQWRSVLESAINLSVSLILVYRIGMYGVLIGTVAALFYRTNDIIIYANTKILNRKPWRTYRRFGVNLAVMLLLICGINRIIGEAVGYFAWMMSAASVTVLCFAVFFTVDSLFDRESFCFVWDFIKAKPVLKKDRRA